MRCQALFTCLLLVRLLYCDAQPQLPLRSGHPLQDLSIAQWTASSGLSSNNITSIFQSKDGLLWVTSFNGFMHFNGDRTEVFDRHNLKFLDTDGFYITVQDDNGTVWLGSQGSGIITYDSGEFNKFTPSEGTAPKSIITLYKTGNNDILIGASNVGLYRIHQNTVTQIHHPDLDHVTVLSIHEDQHGTLWAGTDGKGLFSIVGDKVTQITTTNGLLSNSVGAIKSRSDGGLWIGTNKGLQSFENNTLTSIPELVNNQINSLYVDKSNSVWLGTERGLARINQSVGRTEWLVSKNGIDFVRLSKVIEDREGNIWVSSNRSGIIRLKETNISNITKGAEGISSDRANIIHEGKDGRFYIGTDANQVDVCKSGKCVPVKIKTPVGGNGIRDVYADDDGSLWLATYSGIIHRKPNGEEIVYDRTRGMPAEDFRVIHRDRKGNFWFATRSGGLVKFRDGKIERIYDNNHGFESNYIFAITEDRQGNLYVGTHSGGMSVIDTTGATKTYHLKDDDAGILIFNVDIDTDGRVWAMANTGPVYYDGQSLVPIMLQSDTKGKTYFDWIDDRQGSMWITTSIGILQLKKSDVMKFVNKEIMKVPFHLLDDSDGMNNKECTGATRSLLASDRQIYIPTLGGICRISPALEKKNQTVPNIQIAHFLTDNENQPLFGKSLLVKAGTLRYTFQFRVLSYSAPDRNRFRYVLEGIDKEWSANVALGEVEYTNLPPGEYRFRVTGSNDNDVWNEDGASVSFRVAPFFYQTVWFYVLIVAVVLLLLYGLYRWRISFIRDQNLALKKVNAELDRFVYSASHDLRSPLSSILGLISVARADKANQDMYMDMMEKSVKKLDSFIKDIIEFSRNARLEVAPEAIDFNKMLNDILEDLHFMDNFDKIKKNVSVDVPHSFVTDQKRLRVILSNIIANAIKHHWVRGDDPKVEVTVTQRRDWSVEIAVRDNGPGIPQEHLEDIFKMFFRATDRTSGSGLGLYIVKETVQRLKGDVTVSSGVNEGTVFTITLPLLKVEKSS